MCYFDCIISSVIWPLLKPERIVSEEIKVKKKIKSKQGKTVNPWI